VEGTHLTEPIVKKLKHILATCEIFKDKYALKRVGECLYAHKESSYLIKSKQVMSCLIFTPKELPIAIQESFISDNPPVNLITF
jgi:hypothetical protein